MAGAPLSLKARALRLLAAREYSRAELERKLVAQLRREAVRAAATRPHVEAEDAAAAEVEAAAGDTAPAADDLRRRLTAALDELAARGLLSDARAAEATLASQASRFGTRRIEQTLRAKGLAPELVTAALQQARATELARAREIWQRRFGAAAADPAERARQARFLAGRGFDAEVVRRVVKGVGED